MRAECPGSALIRFNALQGFHVLAQDWTFENLEIEGVCPLDSDCEHAFHVVGNAERFTLRNSRVRDFNAQIKSNGTDPGTGWVWPDDVLIENNELYDTRARQTSNPVTKIDVVGGQVQMLITGFSGAAPHVKAGRLRALGATGAKRMTAVPDLPTIGETVPGYEVTSWYGIVAPAGTPPALIDKLHAELAAMVRKPEVSARLVSLGIEPEGSSPQEFAEQTRREIAKWAKVVKVSGVKLD